MSNTPYYDAYKMYKASKKDIKLVKTYVTLKTGQKVLADVNLLDSLGNVIE